MIKISKKITGASVTTKSMEKTGENAMDNVETSAEKLTEIETTSKSDSTKLLSAMLRPDVLIGETYKIKSGSMPHALYVTINDIVLNKGTINEEIKPYEIFLNSKEMSDFQWIVALTRVISSVFRTGDTDNILSIIEELKVVFDPKGGHFSRKRFIPSTVAEIGLAIEDHLTKIGVIKHKEFDPHITTYLEDKRTKMLIEENKHEDKLTKLVENTLDNTEAQDTPNFPESSIICHNCNVKALVVMDGCYTCLNCAYSKCG
jgi:signal peptidase I